MNGVLLTLEETAAYLATTPRHIRELVWRRKIPVTRVGRLLRFHRDELDTWLAAHTERPR